MTGHRPAGPARRRDTRWRRFAGVTLTTASLAAAAVAMPRTTVRAEPQAAGREESVEQALCRLIEGAAGRQNLPVAFLTNLIWQESSFRPRVISPAGAQGIAQFMPGTARERGLANPFDPEQAVPASAALLAELRDRFGNLGLAAAAYNAGPGRVTAWLAGSGGLPFETENYVLTITGRPAETWRAERQGKPSPPPAAAGQSCAARVATLRVSAGPSLVAQASFAPWGVQLAANFSKARALASFGRARTLYAAVVGDTQPMVIGTRLRTRGTRAFYRVRLPAASRVAADQLCGRIRVLRGACVVLRS